MNFGLWIAFGVGVGAVLASVVDNPGIAIAIGIALSVTVGGVIHQLRRRR